MVRVRYPFIGAALVEIAGYESSRVVGPQNNEMKQTRSAIATIARPSLLISVFGGLQR